MRKLYLVLAFCLLASPAFAQHPCDVAAPATANITQGIPHRVQFCSPEADRVEAAVAYVDGVASSLMPVTAVSVKSSKGEVLYETPVFLSLNNRGNHQLQVAAYNRNSNGTAQEGPKSSPFVFAVSAENPLSLSLTADKPSPQDASASIMLTATAQGGVAPYSYKWMIGVNGNPPALWQNWGINTKSWTPSVSGPGTYEIVVWARSSDSTADAPEAMASMVFVITAPVVPPPGAPRIMGVKR